MVEVEKDYLERLEYRVKKQQAKIIELTEEIERISEIKDNAEFRIRTELEPRIEREKRSYDSWVSANTGERECEHFSDTIDKLEEFVKENGNCFEWEEAESKDIYRMILYIIKNRIDVENGVYSIEERAGKLIFQEG